MEIEKRPRLTNDRETNTWKELVLKEDLKEKNSSVEDINISKDTRAEETELNKSVKGKELRRKCQSDMW